MKCPNYNLTSFFLGARL